MAGVAAAAAGGNEEVDPLTALGTIAEHCPQVVAPDYISAVQQALGGASKVRLLGLMPSWQLSTAHQFWVACSASLVLMIVHGFCVAQR